MDRLAIVRAQRRQQALEALEFERARADALRERLESIVVELEGASLDESVFEAMDAADVAIVRPVLQAPELEAPAEDDWTGLGDSATEGEAASLEEEEIARLEGELASSRQRQRAFERYLDTLGRAD